MKTIWFSLFFFAVASAFAQPGSFDNAFGGNGIVITDFGSSYSAAASSIAMQSDGKIVVAGYREYSSTSAFAVARYNEDGTLDANFGTNGIAITPIGTTLDYAHAVAIQTDGKIVVAGESAAGTGYSTFAIVRYMPDGTLDNSFDGDGKVATAVIAADNVINALAIQPDGKIVVAGYSVPTGTNVALARYNSNGSLDSNFGSGGTVTASLTGNDRANSIAIQSDGKIVVGGTSWGATHDFLLMRYLANGTRDNAFGTNGAVMTEFSSGAQDYGNALCIQDDGKIILAGKTGSQGEFALARYNTAGTLDGQFGTAGKVTTSFGSNAAEATAVALQCGTIVAAGKYQSKAPVARYSLTDGSLDGTFGSGGKEMHDSVAVAGMALQPDGKIVLAGEQGYPNKDFALARIMSCSTTRINEAALANEFSIFPNPSSTHIRLTLSGEFSLVTILDISGKVLSTMATQEQEIAFDISEFPKGLYAVTVQTDGHNITRRFVKE